MKNVCQSKRLRYVDGTFTAVRSRLFPQKTEQIERQNKFTNEIKGEETSETIARGILAYNNASLLTNHNFATAVKEHRRT